MSESLPPSVRKVLRVCRWTWVAAIGVVLAWHVSLLTVQNPEVVRQVILAYIVVCVPIGFGVMLILALWGSLSEAPSTFGRYDELVVACLFVLTGWYQWFRLAPWLVLAWSRSFRTKRASDQTTD